MIFCDYFYHAVDDVNNVSDAVGCCCCCFDGIDVDNYCGYYWFVDGVEADFDGFYVVYCCCYDLIGFVGVDRIVFVAFDVIDSVGVDMIGFVEFDEIERFSLYSYSVYFLFLITK